MWNCVTLAILNGLWREGRDKDDKDDSHDKGGFMYYDRKFLQTSAGQIGVLCVAAGFAQGFLLLMLGSPHSVYQLSGLC